MESLNEKYLSELPQIVGDCLKDIVLCMTAVLGENLLGVYLYGSLVWGDFDIDISDVDMLAVIKNECSKDEWSGLKKMHTDFETQNQFWYDRIEVQYVSTKALANFKTESNTMQIISPGDDFQDAVCNSEWFLNWYFVQNYGVSLYGEEKCKWIPNLSREEYIYGVYDSMLQWSRYIENTRNAKPYQSYAVHTICRGLYSITTGEQTSKLKACEWVKELYPRYAEIIDWSLACRESTKRTAENMRGDNLGQSECSPQESYEIVENFVLELRQKAIDKYENREK